MKTHALSVIALLVAVAALVVANSSRSVAARTETETAGRMASAESGPAPGAVAGKADGMVAQLAALAARVEALEKDVRGDGQLKLLSDINASLQSQAKRADKTSEDVQGVSKMVNGLRSSTQDAMNQVAGEIGRLNGKVAQLDEVLKRQQGR